MCVGRRLCRLRFPILVNTIFVLLRQRSGIAFNPLSLHGKERMLGKSNSLHCYLRTQNRDVPSLKRKAWRHKTPSPARVQETPFVQLSKTAVGTNSVCVRDSFSSTNSLDICTHTNGKQMNLSNSNIYVIDERLIAKHVCTYDGYDA